MPPLAIRVENVSKRYQIGLVPAGYRTLRESLASARTHPLQRIASWGNGRKDHEEDESPIWALWDVTFDVHQGEIVGIIGRNGAEKSTLLKLLSRITEPTGGHVIIAGRVGSLLEVGTGFHPELTGRENIYLNGAILGMRRDEIQKRFDDIVAYSEVERFIDTPVKRYSSGMFLRLAFAVAAHLDPEILLADEVLAVGDQRFQQKCLGTMESAGSEGRTVLFVSHNMPAITRLCERTILLEEGGIVADGPTSSVVARYLNLDEAVRASGASVSWADPERGPGSEDVHLKRMWLLGPYGAPQIEFDVRDPIEIEVQFSILREAPNVVPMFRVFNEDRPCLFASAPTRDPVFAGRSRPVAASRGIL